MYRGSDNSLDILFRFISSASKMFFHTCRQPVITSGEIWRVWRMCQHLPAPALHQILHIMMVLRCSIILQQNDTMLKQFWLFMVNSRPQFMLQDCAVILAIDCSTNWHGIVKHTCILAEEHDMHDFQSILLRHAIFFLGDSWECCSAFCRFSLWSNEYP